MSIAIDPSWFISLGAPASALVIDQLAVTPAGIQFAFPTQAGKSYTVQSATTPGIWSDVETIAGDGSRKNVSYPLAGAQRFYRVKVQ